MIKATNLIWIKVCSDDFGLCVGFGVRLAGKEQRIVLDDAWECLKALVNRQGHGCSCHLTNYLSRERHKSHQHVRFLCLTRKEVGTDISRWNGFLTQDIAGTQGTQWISMFAVTQTTYSPYCWALGSWWRYQNVALVSGPQRSQLVCWGHFWSPTGCSSLLEQDCPAG